MNTKPKPLESKTVIVFILLASAGCSLVSAGIHKRANELEFFSGLRDGIYLVSPDFSDTLLLGAFACFMAVLASAWLAGFKRSWLVFCGIVGVSVIMSAIALLFPFFLGTHRHISEFFLDGFKERVALSGVEGNAIEWANGVFSDKLINPKGEDKVFLRPDRLPDFFKPIFKVNGLDYPVSPQAIVYYDKNRASADEIEIQMTYGVDWGIKILKDPSAIPDSPIDPKPQRCGKRLFVYIYFYK